MSQPDSKSPSVPTQASSSGVTRDRLAANCSGDDNYASSSTSASSASASFAQHQQQYLSAAFQPSKYSSQPQLQQQRTAAQNGRHRATSLMAPSEMPQHLTKNYRELARDFCMLKPFTRLPDGTYPPDTRCVFCEISSPKTVFFPCQHKCVCNTCIKLHDISSDHPRAGTWSACPVCMTDIRLMLPHSGKEEDEYWKWIAEVKPSLAPSFKHEFKDAAKKLRKGSVLPGGPLPPEDAPAYPGTLEKPLSGRRHTWHSHNAQSKGGHAGGDPKTCSIL